MLGCNFLKKYFFNLVSGAVLVLILNCAVLPYALHAAEINDSNINNPFDETIRILERWTSAHWGRDCYVWIVHYPDEIAAPWAEAEALKVGMSQAESEAYRKKFIADLKLDSSETFLVNIYSFGSRPVNIAPIADNIALITPSGERVKPTRYDVGLERPSAGITQGLVFFPKQSDKNYAIAIKGMGVHDERVFSFGTPQYIPPVLNVKANDEPEVVVVDIPQNNNKNKKNNQNNQSYKKTDKADQKKQNNKSRRTVEPAPENAEMQLPPPAPREIPPLFAENSQDMSDFIKSAREPVRLRNAENKSNSGKNAVNKAENKLKEPVKTHKAENAGKNNNNTENAYVSREYVLRHFLTLWADNKPAEMYEMLAESSKKLISRQNFAKEIAKSSDFRAALKGEYKIDWIGEERAKVIADRKVLMFKSLMTRTLGVTRENSSWKVVW